MVTYQKMHSIQSVLKTKLRVWAATSLVALVLVSSTNSNPVEAPTSVDQVSDPDIPEGYAPAVTKRYRVENYPKLAALLARYYGNPYSDEDELMAEKRTSGQEIEEGQHMPSYVQRRSLEEHSARNSYWNLLKALEEQLALEEMSRQGVEDDEPIVNEAEPEEDVHKVSKRRRRYGFWATAINKMDQGNLRGFLGKHRNIYNVYKRQPNKRLSSMGRWMPRALGDHPKAG